VFLARGAYFRRLVSKSREQDLSIDPCLTAQAV